MEPISMMLMMGAGLGMQAFGGLTTNSATREANEAQQRNIQLEQQVEGQRRQMMNLDFQRKSMENLRNAQRARSISLTNATSQGAGFGSGLQGGYGQIAGQSGTNQVGLNQNFQIGQNVFDLNAQISQNKITMANAQMNAQTGQGISSFGSSLVNSATTFGRLASGFGSSSGGGVQSYGSYLGSSSNNAIY